MTTESTTAEAFAPPAASGCCGSPTPVAVDRDPSTCCGTSAEAKAENSCCGPAVKEQAIASGADCCG